jgi:hypothetical protein
MREVFQFVAMLIEEITEAVRQGVSDEEIRQRIAAPNSAGDKLIKAIKARGDKFNDFIDNG